MLTKILENEDWNKKVFIGGFLVLYPRRQRLKKHLNCASLDYKMGKAHKCEDGKVTVSNMSCLSRSIIDGGNSKCSYRVSIGLCLKLLHS